MFNLSPDDRISKWSQFRKELENSTDPFLDTALFWSNAPFVPYNKEIDPFYPRSWPTPWEIIIENKYDDFTKSLMMAWTLKLTDKFKDSKIEIKTLVDRDKNLYYNVVLVNEMLVLNYRDREVVSADSLPNSLSMENLIEVDRPR